MERIKIILAFVLLGSVFIPSGVGFAQVDANFNTQVNNLRSSTARPDDLGFDPCAGNTSTVIGICTTATATALLFNVPGFSTLGPGAVTDNMFGIISGPALGTTAGTGDDTPTTRCAPGFETANFDNQPGISGLRGLNCGDIRINATLQGQDITTFPPGTLVPNTLGGAGSPTQIKNLSFQADFCAAGGIDCLVDDDGDGFVDDQKTAAHVGFNKENNFSFLFVSPTLADTGFDQMVEQVTGVKDLDPTTGVNPLIGTRTMPGTGDQVFSVTTNFGRLPDPPVASTNDPDAIPSNFAVNWTLKIEDPDQSGSGTGKFTQDIGGTFIHNVPEDLGADGALGGGDDILQVFTCDITVAGDVGCSNYPTGASQTEGETQRTGVTNPPFLP
ncbi:MAG: hypothetical protein ACE5HN_01420 [Nitrospiria bacterium]